MRKAGQMTIEKTHPRLQLPAFDSMMPFLKIPKLTYKIKDSYFESYPNLVAQASSYEKIEGFYHKTIDGDDLDVSFDDPVCKS